MPHLHQRILNKIKIQSNSAYNHDAARSPPALCIVFKMCADIYVINVRMQWKSICSIQMYCVLCSWCAQRCKNQSNQSNQWSRINAINVRMQKNQESIELMRCVQDLHRCRNHCDADMLIRPEEHLLAHNSQWIT